MSKGKLKYIYILVVFFILSCAEENMDLVNPPPQSASVRVRFINLVGDFKDRTLVLDSKVNIGPVAYGDCSTAVQPPADSSNVSIILNGTQEYRYSRKIRFIRNNYYTVFALPSGPKDSIQRDMDTLIIASTLAGLIKKPNTAYIRLINVYPDSNRSYSLHRGCPSGAALASNITYRRVGSQAEIASDGSPVSIIRTLNSKSEFINLYNLNLESGRQYAIIINKTSDGQEEIRLLDEFSESSTAFTDIVPEEYLGTKLRTINLSSNEVSFIKQADSVIKDGIIQNLSSMKIGRYIDIGACSSGAKDTIAIMVANDTASYISTSLDVSERYTILTFDSSDIKARLSILSEPYRLETKGYAAVRVVHAAYGLKTVTVSMAARDANDLSGIQDSLGYIAGDLISNKIDYGNISDPILVLPGQNIPVTIFSAESPAHLEYTCIANFEADKKYLFLITTDNSSNQTKVFVVEDNETEKDLQAIEQGVFVQLVNLISGKEQSFLKLNPVLSNVKLNYATNIATVIASGQHSLTINNQASDLNFEIGKRNLIIFSGDENLVKTITFQYDPIETSPSYYMRRFVNASSDIDFLSIKINSDDEKTPFSAERIQFGKIIDMQKITIERNLSIFFINSETNETLYRVDAMPFPFGKNYTVIFGGRAKDNSYTAVKMQEY